MKQMLKEELLAIKQRRYSKLKAMPESLGLQAERVLHTRQDTELGLVQSQRSSHRSVKSSEHIVPPLNFRKMGISETKPIHFVNSSEDESDKGQYKM